MKNCCMDDGKVRGEVLDDATKSSSDKAVLASIVLVDAGQHQAKGEINESNKQVVINLCDEAQPVKDKDQTKTTEKRDNVIDLSGESTRDCSDKRNPRNAAVKADIETFIALCDDKSQEETRSHTDDEKAPSEGHIGVEQSVNEIEEIPFAELQVLLQRQTEVAKAVADQEQSAWEMLKMISHLTQVIADQEHLIMTLQQERAGAERKTAELSFDLRTQRVELAKLKKRAESTEQQLLSTQSKFQSLQKEMKRKDVLLADRDRTIEEMKRKLDKQNLEYSAEYVAEQKRQDLEKRLAEIRSMLSRGKGAETAAVPATTPTSTPSSRIAALRAARDSRLNEIRGLLAKKQTYPTNQGRRDNSVSSTSEESLSDSSSINSDLDSDSDGEERVRLFHSLQRQRKKISS